jgi:Zinc carboxypeptidase
MRSLVLSVFVALAAAAPSASPKSPARALLDSLRQVRPAGPGADHPGAPEAGRQERAPTEAGGPAAHPGADAAAPIPYYWQTRAERTQYKLTADYAETMRYLHQLEGGSRWISIQSYGTSGQGRDLPLVVVSKDRAFTPEAARATGKNLVLIQNGIHSGEIEGKDASLALIRDAAVLRTREGLLDHAILLVLPIFSVDAHERSGPYNRINQNGPDNMGWRATPIGLNLNRDYLKAEAPEMRALIGRVFTQWWPHLLVDDHTTDGSDYRHDLTYGLSMGPTVPRGVDRWASDVFEKRVVPRLAAMGHLPAPYLTFREPANPLSGVDMGGSTPRFSTGYAPLQCRPAILVETHMLKPYATRVKSTYDLLVALLEDIQAHPDDLPNAVTASETEVATRGRSDSNVSRQVVLNTTFSPVSTPFAYRGVRQRLEASEISGAPVRRFSSAAWDTIIPEFRDMVPSLTVTQPIGYLVPQEWTTCREHLDLHGVRYRRFAKAWTDSVEVQHVLDWSAATASFEGHHLISVKKLALERRLRTWQPGDLWVPLDQRSALVAVALFEAQSPDGLMAWNAFDTVFEKKEYAEDYVIEPIAKTMLAADPRLAAEFRARVASDTAFAHSPAARLDFFYRRSKWADPLQDLHPVARALHAPPASVLAP